MAIILSDKYPGRSNPPSLDYPQGSIKDQSAPQAKDGTPLKADWANDHEGFFQSLLKDADITANGNVDTAVSSQYFEALKVVAKKSVPSATESILGVSKIATQAKVNAGVDDSDFVTSKKIRAGFSASFNENGYIAFPTWMGGLIFQWGFAASTNPTADTTWTFPIAFPNKFYSATVAGSNTGNAFYSSLALTPTNTSLSLRSSAVGMRCYVIAVGN